MIIYFIFYHKKMKKAIKDKALSYSFLRTIIVLAIALIIISCKCNMIYVNETAYGLGEEKNFYGIPFDIKKYGNLMLYKIIIVSDTVSLISLNGKSSELCIGDETHIKMREVRHYRTLFPNLPQVKSFIWKNDTIHFDKATHVYLYVNNNIRFVQGSKVEKKRLESVRVP